MTIDPDLHARLTRFHLPKDLLAQLPDPQALASSIRRINSLYQAISSFVPQYIADNETLYTEDYGDLRPGTFMFADVSGFTALSENLQQQAGDDGIDALTEIINDFFAKMLEILAKSNGTLLKFAGDALLIFFPAGGAVEEAPLAIRTGLRMQREMRASFQPIRHAGLHDLIGDHDLELTMSIGICQGQLFEAVVGNDIQRDHVIQGDLPGFAMAAEAAGERDDVIITPDLKTAYVDKFDTVPVGDFFRVIDNFGDELSDYEFTVPRRRRAQTTALFDFVEEHLIGDLERNLERLEGISRFVAKEVIDQLATSSEFRIEAQNRRSTTIFVHFTGFADLLNDWGEGQLPLIVSILNRYYTLMQRTIAANGGVLTRSDPYGRGVKLLITFGAPISHIDDPERAVTTALEMNRVLAQLNARLRDELPDEFQRDVYIQQRFGITHGDVFATEAGWKSRREFTVMGDNVNLAARLMSKSEIGQIIVSDTVWDRVNQHFETERLPPFYLKGKSKPTTAYLVKASTASPLSMSPTSDTPFVGRDLQMLSMTYGLQQAKGPRRPQHFALKGDIGVGKTRMAKHIVEEATKAGFQVAWANCQLSHSQEQSVWSAILFQLLELEQAKSETAQRRLLHVRLDELGLSDLESVFAAQLFGSYQPVTGDETPETDEPTTNVAGSTLSEFQSGKARDQQTNFIESIVRFLATYAEDIPTLLVIDDAHRTDQNTLAILKQVVTEIKRARLMILATYEPIDGFELPMRRKVNVNELDADETEMLATRVLKTRELDDMLLTLIWTRTNGRPLFIESLLHLLEQDQHIERSDLRAQLTGEAEIEALPDDVRELITSQIDRLSPDARGVLQMAAVLGNGFTVKGLLALNNDISELQLEVLLGDLIHAEIIEALADTAFRFRHGLTETTVYESLNRLQRQKLHRLAADFLMAQTDAERYVLKIAYHLVKGGSPLRGIEIVSEAAVLAEQEHHIDRAIELYTHARDIFPHDESIRVELDRLQTLRAT
jgi:adenylate cyclase